MAKYKSRRQYRSRLANQESKRMKRQAIIFLFLTVALVVLLIFVGIPMLIRFAVFISSPEESDNSNEQTDQIPPQTPQLNAILEATNSAQLSLQGFTEPGATVTLFHNNQEVVKSIVDATGSFEFQNVLLDSGTNSFYAIAKDQAANESQRSLIRTIEYDTQPPEMTLTSPEDGDYIVGVRNETISVTGTTEPGSKVILNTQVLVVKTDGSFTTQLKLNEGDNTFTLQATDPAGNSTELSRTVQYSRQ